MASDTSWADRPGRMTPTEIDTSLPHSARAYGWMLGLKDNFPADRDFLLNLLPNFPECLDIARQNRQFLYRVVSYLAAPPEQGGAGISQFIDFGCGLPTGDNVHQVAKRFSADARVVYADIDPIVLTHGRALLAEDESTTIIQADMRDPAILQHPDLVRLIDFTQPVAVLYLSVGHHLKDDPGGGLADARDTLHAVIDHAVPGSHIAASQVVCDDPARGRAFGSAIDAAGIPWQSRTPAEFATLLDGLSPLNPGLVNLKEWRPDPNQPPLPSVDLALSPFEGRAQGSNLYEYGGVLTR
ncbi:SAM-dependent methyltransferase [Actinomadura sp. 1N219]|uniref:SAM-dependent methyltransferase n=1 Tax=Actinomadura sp. 1N219 TaxID=3375152 RepID=UPI0037B8FC99